MKRSVIVVLAIIVIAGAAMWRADATIRHRHGLFIHCLSNLRQLDSAKEQIALRDNLQPGAEVESGDVVRYCRPANTNCLAGGTITIGRIGEDPSCTVHGSMSHPVSPRASLFRK